MRMNRSRIPLVGGVILSLLATAMNGCGKIGPLARSHFDVTRELGIFPPRIEEDGDFKTAAKARCDEYDDKTPVLPDCIRYHEALLWASDYKSFAGARAALNKNIIWAAGALGLASAGALAGLSTFGSTNSDAYKILPIVGTFVAGLLGFSQNDALAEAYQEAETDIDQAIRRAKNRAISVSGTAYKEAEEQLRNEVGGAIDELDQKKSTIRRFQGKNTADQFKELQKAKYEGELSGVSLKSVDTNPANTKGAKLITVALNQPLDPQKVTPEELRIKLMDTQSGAEEFLRISTIQGDKLIADIPQSLQDHLPARTYLVTVHARHGKYIFKEAFKLPLDWSKARLVVKVKGTGTVKVPYPTSDPAKTDDQICSKERECEGPIDPSKPITLTASTGSPTWDIPTAISGNPCPSPSATCTVPASRINKDTTVTVTFP